MKRIFGVLACLMLLVFVPGCKEEEEISFYKVSPMTLDAGDEGITTTVEINSNSDWRLTSSSSWIRFSPMSGSGSGTVEVTISKNTGTSGRTGTLVVHGTSGASVATVSISQAGPEFKVDNLVIAHRGAYAEFGLPDNSLAALKKAIELGLYGSECDINITTDGQVIVVHGESFGGLPVLHYSYSSLRAAGKLKNGESLPLLSEFLTAVKEGCGTKLFIDVKSLSDEGGGNNQSIRAGKAAVELIKRMGVQDRVAFIIGRIGVFNGVIDDIAGEWPVAYMNYSLSPQEHRQYTKDKSLWGNFDISGFGKNPSSGAFDADYAEAQYQKWCDAGLTLSFYNIDTEPLIRWYLPHKETLVVCTNYPVQLLERIGKR